MARPYKTGLDYFELDCYMDDKIKLIQGEFGLKGFAVVVKLFQVIYRERGYYCEWNKDKAVLFVCEECADCVVSQVQEIVEACIRRDIFSKKLFQKYGILTSKGIQKRYFNAIARRENVEVNEAYLLVKVAHKKINVNNNPVNVCNNSNNVDNNSQRKEKKRKEKNTVADAIHSDDELVGDDW